MDIFRPLRRLVALRRSSIPGPDYLLDFWIREALRQDAITQPSPGAWDRLRKTVIDRRLVHGSEGNWVFRELFDDASGVSGYFQREGLRRSTSPADRSFYQHREEMWSSVLPPFVALVHL